MSVDLTEKTISNYLKFLKDRGIGGFSAGGIQHISTKEVSGERYLS